MFRRVLILGTLFSLLGFQLPAGLAHSAPITPTSICPTHQLFDGHECVDRCDASSRWDIETARCVGGSVPNPEVIDPVTPEVNNDPEIEESATDETVETTGKIIQRLRRARDWFVRGVSNMWTWLKGLFPESSFEIKEPSPAGGVRG